MPKSALVLNGGGFRGVKQVGLPKEMWRRGKPPDIIQGVSVGALNAAKLVESGPIELEKSWFFREKRGPHSIFNWRGAVLHAFSNHLLSDSGLNELVNELDMNKIIASQIELQVIVRNESRHKLEVFTNRDPQFINNPENLRKGIKASASLRGIFPPVEINGEWYCDPYYFKLEELVDCDTIFVLLNDEEKNEQQKEQKDKQELGADFHLAIWYKRFFVDFNEFLDDLNYERAKEFLDSHPEFGEFKVESNLKWAQKTFKHWAEKLKSVLGSRRLVFVSPDYIIPTLTMDSFNKGDFRKGVDLSTEQGKRVLDNLGI